MASRGDLLSRWQRVRQASLAMVAPLKPEECRIQPCAEVSPSWWNLAHTSWFFVRNVLASHKVKAQPQDALFDYVLNSYYTALGPRLQRDRRGLMTRPSMEEVLEYRSSVDHRVLQLIETIEEENFPSLAKEIEIGLQHEQQHQELFYTEIKFILYQNPLQLRRPYKMHKPAKKSAPVPTEWVEVDGGLLSFGNLEGGWEWDCEGPIHKAYLEDFALQNRLVTNEEYLEFMQDKGYASQLLWLDNGWNKAQALGWEAPLYWEKVDGEWQQWTLHGMQPLALHEPVCHLSFYEAEAYATWKKARLPTEREWEQAARTKKTTTPPNFLQRGALHPTPAVQKKGLQQLLGDLWEWTSSYYEAYPGYQPYAGALQEYNEKFMDNQRILRGGSCVSEEDHIRISYRNFWSPETRFQFTGLRLSRI